MLQIALVLDYLYLIIDVHTGAGRYQLTDDYIFLQTQQMVALAPDCSIRQRLCGFLEGSGGQEALRTGGSLGDTLQHRCGGNQGKGLLTVVDPLLDLLVDLCNLLGVYQSTGEQIAAAGILNLDLAQHLAHDNLNVLVVDVNTLETVYLWTSSMI